MGLLEPSRDDGGTAGVRGNCESGAIGPIVTPSLFRKPILVTVGAVDLKSEATGLHSL